MNSRDDLEQRLPTYFDRRAAMPPHGLLDDLLRETETVPQRRGRFALASFGWWAAGAAAAAMLLIAVVWLKTGLPAPSVGPGAHVSSSPSAQERLTTITVSVPVPVPMREKVLGGQALATFQARLRALGIGNFSSVAGDEFAFTMSIPPSVDRADVDAVLQRVGEVEWLAWPDDLPPPAEGDQVPAGVLPLFDASDQIKSVLLHAGSVADVGDPQGVEVTFGSAASEALATYTASHLNRPMPLAMDGKILISPTIQGAISSGDLFISMGPPDGPISPAALAAILESGPLPQGWTTTN